MTLKPYTVILLYPRNVCDGGTQTYLNHVMAPNTEFAIRECQEMAEADNNGNPEASEFEALYVFAGHVEVEWSEMP